MSQGKRNGMRKHMERAFAILIADRNRHVRELLKRELEAESFQVLLAKSSQEVLNRIADHESFDLLILDPDLPDAEELPLLEKLQNLAANVPLIIHTFVSGYGNNLGVAGAATFVERRGDSVELLKKIVLDIAKKSISCRTRSLSENEPLSSARSCESE